MKVDKLRIEPLWKSGKAKYGTEQTSGGVLRYTFGAIYLIWFNHCILTRQSTCPISRTQFWELQAGCFRLLGVGTR